ARERTQRLHAVMEEACRFYEAQLTAHPTAQLARDELQARGITLQTASAFRLGFAPHAWDALTTHLASKGFSAAEAEQVGLLAKRRDGSGHYDRFRGRLMFPVRELSGRVLAFSGRILPPPKGQQPSENEPKYVNSPEGPLYTK